MDESTKLEEPQALLLTDRSRFSLGWGRCPRARYMEYHSGPEGYGQKRKSASLPLATGDAIHRILAYLTDENLDRPGARAVIIKEVTGYQTRARAAGLYELASDIDKQALEFVISEQAALIEGLSWAFWRAVRPWLLRTYTIIASEQEYPTVIGCTCGGTEVLSFQDHAARWCQGVVLQTRPDLIVQSKETGVLKNVDFKTGGDIHSKSWAEQWEDSVQFGIGSMAAEQVHGPINEGAVIGVLKGRRQADWDPAQGKEFGEKRQHSWLCYAYYKAGQPPFEPEDWKLSYWTTDPSTGKRWGATEKRGYNRVPVWMATFSERPADWTNMEYWVEAAPEEEVKKLFRTIDPLPTPRAQLGNLKAALVAEERRVNEGLWAVYQAASTHGLGSAEHIQALNVAFPQSWECYRYTGRCQFWRICKLTAGWEDFYRGTHPDYVMRTPHHQQELEQAKARGVKFPTDATEEEEG